MQYRGPGEQPIGDGIRSQLCVRTFLGEHGAAFSRDDHDDGTGGQLVLAKEIGSDSVASEQRAVPRHILRRHQADEVDGCPERTHPRRSIRRRAASPMTNRRGRVRVFANRAGPHHDNVIHHVAEDDDALGVSR